MIRPLSRLHHPREVVRQVTSNWFTATMGTGILALALNQLPGGFHSIKVLAQSLWFAIIVLFKPSIILSSTAITRGHCVARPLLGHRARDRGARVAAEHEWRDADRRR